MIQKTLKHIIKTYQKAISQLNNDEDMLNELNYEHLGFTLGAMQYN